MSNKPIDLFSGETFPMTSEDYLDHCDAYDGICLACGEIHFGGVEPDAENYHCDACGKDRVCGVENALMIGKIDIR